MKTTLLLLLSICSFISISLAQTDDGRVMKTVMQKDSLFWTGYNTCNYDGLGEYIADDIEFYHDKGGITLGKSGLIDSIRKNLCSKQNFRTRREANPETVKIYLLKNSNVIYGAIISGEHYFFNSYDNKPEKREGIAKFMNMWILKDDVWKMSRILSYDHNPAPYENKRQAKTLPEEMLSRFSGEYIGTRSGNASVIVGKGVLTLITGNSRFNLFSETDNRFFVKERDLTFEFISEKGKVTKMIIRENGDIVEESQIKK
jgi:hypothetical protein